MCSENEKLNTSFDTLPALAEPIPTPEIDDTKLEHPGSDSLGVIGRIAILAGAAYATHKGVGGEAIATQSEALPPSGELIRQPFTYAGIAISGLRRSLESRKSRVESKIARLQHTTEVRQGGAESQLRLRDSSRPQTIPTRRESNSIQELGVLRSNLQHDKAKAFRYQGNKYLSLAVGTLRDKDGNPVKENEVANILSDKQLLKEALATGAYSRSQKKAMKQAAKQFRSARSKELQMIDKLESKASGDTLSSDRINRKIRAKQRKLDKLNNRIDQENRGQAGFVGREESAIAHRPEHTKHSTYPPRPSGQRKQSVDHAKIKPARTKWGERWRLQQEENRKGVI